MKAQLFILFFLLILINPLNAQVDKLLEKEVSGYVNPEELVTMAETTPFSKAIELLNAVSEKLSGQRIVSTAEISNPIGVQIVQMPYKKALMVIVQYQNLIFEEKPDVIIIKTKGENVKLDEKNYAPVDAREVKISALFFEADVAEMRTRGINWSWLLSKNGITIGSDLYTTTQAQNNSGSNTTSIVPEWNLNTESEFDIGSWQGTATGFFKFFEENQLGEVIANPSVVVRDKEKGRIQIGSDYSIKQRDFAGNVTDQFFSTGSIVEVTPYVYNEDGIDYILLQLDVERSSAFPSEVSTEIRKTKATTQVLMLNGEETVIGGLFINEEKKTRNGIPVLKDLPWWVLGIRYLTGSDDVEIKKKEVIILIKTEIIPTLKERMAGQKELTPIKNQKDMFEQKILDIKQQTKTKQQEE